MAKKESFNITAGVTTFSTASGYGATSKETVRVILVPADPADPEVTLTQGTDYEAGHYRVDGVANGSDSVRIYWPNASNYVGDGLRVEIYTDLSNPVVAQLHNFEATGHNTPKQFQDQMQQVFSVFTQILGGQSLGTVDFGDVAANVTAVADHETRIMQNEADIATLNAEQDAQDATLADHETRISTNEIDITNAESSLLTLNNMIGGAVGLPTVAAPDADKILKVNGSGSGWELQPITSFAEIIALMNQKDALGFIAQMSSLKSEASYGASALRPKVGHIYSVGETVVYLDEDGGGTQVSYMDGDDVATDAAVGSVTTPQAIAYGASTWVIGGEDSAVAGDGAIYYGASISGSLTKVGTGAANLIVAVAVKEGGSGAVIGMVDANGDAWQYDVATTTLTGPWATGTSTTPTASNCRMSYSEITGEWYLSIDLDDVYTATTLSTWGADGDLTTAHRQVRDFGDYCWAFGTGSLLRTTDGTTWTAATYANLLGSTPSEIVSLGYYAGVYVAITGNDGTSERHILVSHDAAIFEAVTVIDDATYQPWISWPSGTVYVSGGAVTAKGRVLVFARSNSASGAVYYTPRMEA